MLPINDFNDKLNDQTFPLLLTKLITQYLFCDILLTRTAKSFLVLVWLMAAYMDEGLWRGNDTEIGF